MVTTGTDMNCSGRRGHKVLRFFRDLKRCVCLPSWSCRGENLKSTVGFVEPSRCPLR
jgi:hypothetical protein